MSKWFGKKQVLLAVLVVSLGVAVYLNYYFASSDPLSMQTGATGTTTGKHLGDSLYVDATTGASTAPTTGASYFEAARQNRQNARTEALEILQDTLQDVKITEDLQKEALARVESIALAVERESAIESLVLAKGFRDCVAYIDGENCHLVVQSETLYAAQTLQILEIVTTQAPIKAEKVNIVTVNS